MRTLTLDLGTGALKVCLWRDAVQIARLSAPIPTRLDRAQAEQDAHLWWTEAIRLVHTLVQTHPEAAETDVIGITGHMHALVPTDADGVPLGPVAIVSDRRAHQAVRELKQIFGSQTILQWTGGRMDPTCVLAKARHFHRAGDPAWQSARWLLPPKDFLRMQLTGIAQTDPIDAAGTMLWDITRQTWHPDLLAFTGCSPDVLPEIRPTVSLAGKLTASAAELLGLRAGTPVATGGGDDIEAFGAGALNPGDIYEHLGTTGSIYVASELPVFDPMGCVETYPDVAEGHWLIGGSTSAAGLAHDWARALLKRAPDWKDAKALFQRMAGDGQPGTVLFLPYLVGERAPLWDPYRTAAFLGLRAQDDADTLLQATVEGVLFSLRTVLDALERTGAVSSSGAIFASGPLGADEALGQVRADIYGRQVTRLGTTADTSSFAAMILAVCALTQEDPYAMAKQILTPVWSASPRPSAQARYARAYRRFCRATELLSEEDILDMEVPAE